MHTQEQLRNKRKFFSLKFFSVQERTVCQSLECSKIWGKSAMKDARQRERDHPRDV